MPGVTPLRPDDVQSARAWAAFVAEDAGASAPPSLEARVLRAAHAAIAQKRRDEAERKRRQWFCGIPRWRRVCSRRRPGRWGHGPRRRRHGRRDDSGVGGGTHRDNVGAAGTDDSGVDGRPQRPLPMTNVEAGRVLATPRRPGSQPAPCSMRSTEPVPCTPRAGRGRSPSAPRPSSPWRSPVDTRRRLARPHAPPGSAEPVPLATAPAALAGTAPEAWSSRGAKPVFDPETAEIAPPPPVHRLDQATPVPPPREDPPAPPK